MIAYSITVIPTMYIIFVWLLEGAMKDFFYLLRMPFLIGIVELTAINIWEYFALGYLNDFSRLVIGLIIASMIYVIMVRSDVSFLKEIYHIIPERFSNIFLTIAGKNCAL